MVTSITFGAGDRTWLTLKPVEVLKPFDKVYSERYRTAQGRPTSLDDSFKQNLLDSNILLITVVKIGLHCYVTADLILQLELLKS